MNSRHFHVAGQATLPGPAAARLRRAGIALRPGTTWSSLVGPAPEARDPLGDLGKPAFWKTAKHPGGDRRVFDLPMFALAEDPSAEDDEEETDGGPAAPPPLDSCLEWALATADGRTPRDWRAPAPCTIATWTAGDRLTIQHEEILRRIEVAREDDRLALRVTLLEQIPGQLPATRQEWLRKVLADAQSRWRLVRLGFDDDSAAVAEIDLSGAPEPLLRRLFLAAIDCLRGLVAWLAELLEFLADPDAESQALLLRPAV